MSEPLKAVGLIAGGAAYLAWMRWAVQNDKDLTWHERRQRHVVLFALAASGAIIRGILMLMVYFGI